MLPVKRALLLSIFFYITNATSSPSLQVLNVEQCLECTGANCWFCESDQISSDGRVAGYCYCDRVKDKPAPGYCGSTTYADFKRYANNDRECIEQAQGPGGSVEETKIEEPQEEIVYLTQGTSLGVVMTLILAFCCVGYGSGCLCMFYLCRMKIEQEEEERRDRVSMMKVVTARDIDCSKDNSLADRKIASVLNSDII